MKLMTCPINGPRNVSEFSYGGELQPMPNDESCELKSWVEYVFFHENRAANVLEWWCHTPTSYWFLAERNTVTDTVLRTFQSSEIFQQRIEFTARENASKSHEE